MKTINISNELGQELVSAKYANGYKSLDELISKLLSKDKKKK